MNCPDHLNPGTIVESFTTAEVSITPTGKISTKLINVLKLHCDVCGGVDLQTEEQTEGVEELKLRWRDLLGISICKLRHSRALAFIRGSNCGVPRQ